MTVKFDHDCLISTQAYKMGLTTPAHVWIFPAWYDPDWYKDNYPKGNVTENTLCTKEQVLCLCSTQLCAHIMYVYVDIHATLNSSLSSIHVHV